MARKKIKILDKTTIEEIIKLIESEEYIIFNEGIFISDEDGIVLTLKIILKGKNKRYGTVDDKRVVLYSKEES